jgi:hypothetical protein
MSIEEDREPGTGNREPEGTLPEGALTIDMDAVERLAGEAVRERAGDFGLMITRAEARHLAAAALEAEQREMVRAGIIDPPGEVEAAAPNGAAP